MMVSDMQLSILVLAVKRRNFVGTLGFFICYKEHLGEFGQCDGVYGSAPHRSIVTPANKNRDIVWNTTRRLTSPA